MSDDESNVISLHRARVEREEPHTVVTFYLSESGGQVHIQLSADSDPEDRETIRTVCRNIISATNAMMKQHGIRSLRPQRPRGPRKR